MRIHGNLLRKLRKRLGLTQQEVADAIGCSRSSVSEWETRGRVPRAARLKALASLLRVKVSDLLAPPNPTSLKELRTSAGLLQESVAKRLGVRNTTYCDVENGRQRIPARWIPILSELFDIPGPALIQLPGPPKKSTKAQRGPRRNIGLDSGGARGKAST
ncbi:helix-turn-helix domain-containing protein [Kitasatospora sp. NPDC004723]|uniref:helix-turn-helix transcriptional regulator n=1 Tax=Kitasatospora sp. NPDC004723 TaxID=3154288 RepID=UPI0033BBEF14